MYINNNSKVLLQGDSVTDFMRNRQDACDMGTGYAMILSAWFSALYPEKYVTFMNRGISGNRVRDLKARWEEDCLLLHPDWVSILIGINEAWRRYDSNDPTADTDFENDYRDILTRIKSRLNARIILCEPFLLPVSEQMNRLREDLDPKIEIVRKLARQFNAVLVPLDGIFARACTIREPSFWAPDGVHPSPAGHALIAKSWLESVKAL